MKEFFQRIFGVKYSSAKNVGKTIEVEQPETEKKEIGKEVFFNTPRNVMLLDISQALSDARHDTLRVLVERYKKNYGRLSRDDFFYRYDKVACEWYMCAPLYKWCCDLETRDLFYKLCEKC